MAQSVDWRKGHARTGRTALACSACDRARFVSGFSRRARYAPILVALAFLLAGCGWGGLFGPREPAVPLELDYNRVLPAGWRPITRWYEVNIDGDGDTEYLLLFTYDSGQVGAVIYDQQVSTDLGTRFELDANGDGMAIPLQSFGYFRPYLLLPSNWDFTYGGAVSHGFVALPADADNIVVSEAQRAGIGANSGALADNGASATRHPSSELVLQGGSSHLTFVWWKNRDEGYGVTQLYAPGGFRGVDWVAWREAPQPIERIYGLFPLHDYRARSLLCREIEYGRVGAARTDGALGLSDDLFMTGHESLATPHAPNSFEEDAGIVLQEPPQLGVEPEDVADDIDGQTASSAAQPDSLLGAPEHLPGIAFSQRDMGIKFCTAGAPAHPFYPEGVALAYVLSVMDAAQAAPINNIQSGADHLVTAGIGPGFVLDALDVVRLADERVEDIQSFATVPVSTSVLQNGVFAPTTGVCVELAQKSEPTQRRWLLFTLRYHPPDMEARTSDRWTISGVTQEPAPQDTIGQDASGGGGQGSYCRQILGLD